MGGQGHILPGRTWWRGDAGYERVRLNLVWNGCKPGRYPAVIVAPSNAAEVADTVNHARRHGLKVKARSGGHLTDNSMAVMAAKYLVGYGACEGPADDARVRSRATSHRPRFEPLAAGMQLGDENLASRPDARILKPGTEAQLENLRAKSDRDGPFHSYYLGAEARQRPIEQRALTKDV